jgi:hypothetical protein
LVLSEQKMETLLTFDYHLLFKSVCFALFLSRSPSRRKKEIKEINKLYEHNVSQLSCHRYMAQYMNDTFVRQVGSSVPIFFISRNYWEQVRGFTKDEQGMGRGGANGPVP